MKYIFNPLFTLIIGLALVFMLFVGHGIEFLIIAILFVALALNLFKIVSVLIKRQKNRIKTFEKIKFYIINLITLLLVVFFIRYLSSSTFLQIENNSNQNIYKLEVLTWPPFNSDESKYIELGSISEIKINEKKTIRINNHHNSKFALRVIHSDTIEQIFDMRNDCIEPIFKTISIEKDSSLVLKGS